MSDGQPHSDLNDSAADMDDTPRGRLLRKILFANWSTWGDLSKQCEPAYHGESWPYRIRNLYIENTLDKIKLGAWHFLPEDLVVAGTTPTEAVSDAALKDPKYLTILYLHGMGATRYQGHRTRFGLNMSDRNINMISIDYRGYADSSKDKNPTERGVIRDARAAFDWIVSKGALPENVVIVGHSLGTGIAAALAAQLSLEGIIPRALILIAPYTSIKSLLLTYRAGGWVPPVFAALNWIPVFNDHLLGRLNTPFNSETAIADVKCPIALIHAKDDYQISSTYSHRLFNIATNNQDSKTWKIRAEASANGTTLTANRVRSQESSAACSTAPSVVFHEVETGGHENIESAQQSLQTMMDLINHASRPGRQASISG